MGKPVTLEYVDPEDYTSRHRPQPLTVVGTPSAGSEGPEGPQGPQGPEGPEGPEGPAGADGNGWSPAAVAAIAALDPETSTVEDVVAALQA